MGAGSTALTGRIAVREPRDKLLRDAGQALSKAQALIGISEIGKVIATIREISTSISSAAEEQSAATREASSHINGVKQAAEDNGRSAGAVLNFACQQSELATRLQDLSAEAQAQGRRDATPWAKFGGADRITRRGPSAASPPAR